MERLQLLCPFLAPLTVKQYRSNAIGTGLGQVAIKILNMDSRMLNARKL